MGDRSRMQVTTLEEHVPFFKDLGFTDECDIDNGVAYMVDYEAAGGHYDDMPNEIPFIAYYEAGSEYGAGGIVCDGEDAVEVSVNKEYMPVVEVENDGKIRKEQLKAAGDFWKLEKKVRLLFKIRQTP